MCCVCPNSPSALAWRIDSTAAGTVRCTSPWPACLSLARAGTARLGCSWCSQSPLRLELGFELCAPLESAPPLSVYCSSLCRRECGSVRKGSRTTKRQPSLAQDLLTCTSCRVEILYHHARPGPLGDKACVSRVPLCLRAKLWAHCASILLCDTRYQRTTRTLYGYVRYKDMHHMAYSPTQRVSIRSPRLSS